MEGRRFQGLCPFIMLPRAGTHMHTQTHTHTHEHMHKLNGKAHTHVKAILRNPSNSSCARGSFRQRALGLLQVGKLFR